MHKMGDITQNMRIVDSNIALNSTMTEVNASSSNPVVALNKRGKSKTWTTFSLTTSLIVVFSKIETVSCASFCLSNFSSAATMQVEFYDTAGSGTPSSSTAFINCCEYSPAENTTVGFSYAGGTYATVYFPETTAAKIKINILDTANTDGKLEAAYLVVGKYWSPSVNAEYGLKMSYVDSSKRSRNGAGDLMVDNGFINKELAFNLNWLNDVDRKKLVQMSYAQGMNNLIFIDVYPKSTDKNQQQIHQIYGVNVTNASVNNRVYLIDSTTIKIQEI